METALGKIQTKQMGSDNLSCHVNTITCVAMLTQNETQDQRARPRTGINAITPLKSFQLG